MITLSRNTPVALVAGGAGFLGSHVIDKLLERNVQVVGIDNLSSGDKANLLEVSKNKRFHFLNQSIADQLLLGLPRLDYAIFCLSENQEDLKKAFTNFLNFIQAGSWRKNCKIILVSSIKLYDHTHKHSALEDLEKQLVEVSKVHSLNARVVRLGAVFGPRMHFREDDPNTRLLKLAIAGRLEQETLPLDFISRGIFVSDAVNLIIKALFHGSTAHKVYDGVAFSPLKISEVRQLLLDPLWHESQGFTPTKLPTWPTPNLYQTSQELAWQPQTPLISALKETLAYFKGREDLVAELKKQSVLDVKLKEAEKGTAGDVEDKAPVKPKMDLKMGQSFFTSKAKLTKTIIGVFTHYLIIIVGLTLIFYALLYPTISFFAQTYLLRFHLEKAFSDLKVGDLEKAVSHAEEAQNSIRKVNSFIEGLAPIKKLAFTAPYWERGMWSLLITGTQVEAVENSLKATSSLTKVLLDLGNGGSEDAQLSLEEANLGFQKAAQNFAFLQAVFTDPQISQKVFQPDILGVQSFGSEVANSQISTQQGRILSLLLDNMIAAKGPIRYLVVLYDNTNLRPVGGSIKAIAEITFNEGKLVSINSDTSQVLDQKLKEKIEFPAQVQKEYGFSVAKMEDASLDPDFPTSAKYIQWLYAKQTGTLTSGVVAVDLQGLSSLLEVLEPIEVDQTKGTFDHTNIMEKSLGTPKDTAVLAEVLKRVLQQIFFLEKHDWQGLTKSLQKNLQEKHLLAYINDQEVFPYFVALNWVGEIKPQQTEKKGERSEFIALREGSLKSNNANYYLKRELDLVTSVSQTGIINHRLKVIYTNQNPVADLALGTYQNRLKLLLPAGTRVTKASFKGKDILKEISAFSDYGRAGHSMLLEVTPKETAELVLEYQDVNPLVWEKDQTTLNIQISKQPGTDKDKLSFKLIYPETWQARSALQPDKAGELTEVSDLSSDKLYKITLQKKQ